MSAIILVLSPANILFAKYLRSEGPCIHIEKTILNEGFDSYRMNHIDLCMCDSYRNDLYRQRQLHLCHSLKSFYAKREFYKEENNVLIVKSPSFDVDINHINISDSYLHIDRHTEETASLGQGVLKC